MRELEKQNQRLKDKHAREKAKPKLQPKQVVPDTSDETSEEEAGPPIPSVGKLKKNEKKQTKDKPMYTVDEVQEMLEKQRQTMQAKVRDDGTESDEDLRNKNRYCLRVFIIETLTYSNPNPNMQ